MPLFQEYGFSRQHGLPRTRKCMQCGRVTEDNGTIAWIRGFCNEDCRQDYIKEIGVRK